MPSSELQWGLTEEYPNLVFNDCHVIQRVAPSQMGQRKLEQVDMKALVSSIYVRWKMHGNRLSLDGNNSQTPARQEPR